MLCLLLLKSLQEIILIPLEPVVIKGTRDLNLQRWSWSHRLDVYVGDLKREQVVHVRIRSKSRKSVELEPSLITVLDLLRIKILNYKSQLAIVNCSLGMVPPRLFILKRVVSLVFLGHHILCYLLFCYVFYFVMIV